jgi:uncharacterized protein (TIGR01777 family)
MNVFVAGGTGLIGCRLVRRLLQRQDKVVIVTRRPETAQTLLGSECRIVPGDPTQPGPWMDAVADCQAVVNLAGENLFSRRWNADFKQVLRDSRVKSTENLVKALAQSARSAAGTPRVLVNASAVGYYGPQGDEELTEESPPAKDFLGQVCVEWERAASKAESAGVRVAIVRIGVVLDRKGGALGRLLPQFQVGMGGSIGSGKQWISWIHHADLTGILLLALDNPSAQGPINAMAPHPVTNRDFAQGVAQTLGRPSFLSMPEFALRMMLGEVADVVLTGQRVLPKKALALGYGFQFPTLNETLADALKETEEG